MDGFEVLALPCVACYVATPLPREAMILFQNPARHDPLQI
jgi:hypothetical protein